MDDADMYAAEVARLEQKLASVLRERDELLATVGFYANRANWPRVGHGYQSVPAHLDGGRRARQALEQRWAS